MNGDLSSRVICIPYDSGHRDRRMGAGPRHLLRNGVEEKLAERGIVEVEILSDGMSFPTEVGSAFELHRRGARAVSDALRDGQFPVVLSGNCSSSLGTVAGIQQLSRRPIGVIWFDGHGDCNTPTTFEGDFLDAMGLSTLTGRCWQALVRTVPGFHEVRDEHVVLIGGHGADEGAREVLASSSITVVSPDQLSDGGLSKALNNLAGEGITEIYLHLDLDVLDAGQDRANEFAPPGGIEPAMLVKYIDQIACRFWVCALGVASFDPVFDARGIVTKTATAAIDASAAART